MLRLAQRSVSIICISQLLLAGAIQARPPAKPRTLATTTTTIGNGLRVIAFELPAVKVKVNLPDDIRAGDTISGTVTAESASGADTLSGYVLEIGNAAKMPVQNRNFTFQAPTFGSIGVVLKDAAGAGTAFSAVEVKAAATALPSGFTFSPIAQQGRPMTIAGPFDGDFSTTNCTLGGQSVALLAESPSAAVFSSPSTVTGPAEIVISERGRSERGTMRNVGVRLSAPKTALKRGESTTLTVEVSGLQGMTNSVPLELICSGVVNMQGGNAQQPQVKPSDVQPDGTATVTRTLTGVQPGAFNVRATVVTNVVPISNLSGEIVHVEGSPNGGNGVWQVKIKLPGGKIVNIYIRSEQKPNLQFCNWIKLDDVTSENGTIYVGGHKTVPDPNKKPPKPAAPPKPPADTRPPTTGTPPGPTTTAQPCMNGDTRNISAEKKTFEVMDGESEPIFKLYTDKDDAGAAAQNMADFWRQIAKAGGLLDYLPEGAGAGPLAAEWLFEYLDKGADILDAVAKSKLKNLGVSKVTAEVIITTKKITVVCITYEICIDGKWVRKKRLEQSEERSIFRAHKTAEKGSGEWDKVSEPSRPQFFDPERAEAWARDFFKDQANILKGNGEGYAEFVKNCK